MVLVTLIQTTSLLILFTDAMVVVMKNKYEEGTPEYEAFEAGVAAERLRLRKILEKYHNTFGSGHIEESSTKMEIRYMYDYIIESRSLK